MIGTGSWSFKPEVNSLQFSMLIFFERVSHLCDDDLLTIIMYAFCKIIIVIN